MLVHGNADVSAVFLAATAGASFWQLGAGTFIVQKSRLQFMAFYPWSHHCEPWSVTVTCSFRLLYNGRPLGNHYGLGDLANQDDLFFYLFGAYEYPVEVR